MQVGIGLAIGVATTIFGGRVMASQLFGVTPHHPVVLLVTAAVLATAAFVAAIIQPAERQKQNRSWP